MKKIMSVYYVVFSLDLQHFLPPVSFLPAFHFLSILYSFSIAHVSVPINGSSISRALKFQRYLIIEQQPFLILEGKPREAVGEETEKWGEVAVHSPQRGRKETRDGTVT